MKLKELKKKIEQLYSKYKFATETVDKEKRYLISNKEFLKDCMEAHFLIQEFTSKIQQNVHKKISGVVTKCLRSIFKTEAYQFKLLFEKKRGRTQVLPVFIRNGKILREPLEECGHGAVGIAAFAERLVCLKLSKPKLRNVLILDEPFKDLSPEYRHLVPELIETLAQELDLQIIFTTNQPEYACGEVVRLQKDHE